MLKKKTVTDVVRESNEQIEKILQKAQKKVAELQKKCKHENTHWMRLTEQPPKTITLFCFDCGVILQEKTCTKELAKVIEKECHQFDEKINAYFEQLEKEGEKRND